MKKLLFFLTIFFGLSTASFAQKAAKLKEGVMKVNDKVMVCKAGKCSPLTTTYTCSDQCKISQMERSQSQTVQQ